MVYFRLQTIKQKYLVDTLSYLEFHFEVLKVAAAKEPIFVQLHKLRVEHQPKKCTKPTIRFIESAALELGIISSHIKVDLFLMIECIGSHVVVQNVLFFLELHELYDRAEGVALFECE
jgi:hypothetical protein